MTLPPLDASKIQGDNSLVILGAGYVGSELVKSLCRGNHSSKVQFPLVIATNRNHKSELVTKLENQFENLKWCSFDLSLEQRLEVVVKPLPLKLSSAAVFVSAALKKSHLGSLQDLMKSGAEVFLYSSTSCYLSNGQGEVVSEESAIDLSQER
jgi:nucleoside-diphosphate-sugar epimerase